MQTSCIVMVVILKDKYSIEHQKKHHCLTFIGENSKIVSVCLSWWNLFFYANKHLKNADLILKKRKTYEKSI